MYYHCLIISYKGTSYYGWQDLGTSNEKKTIQSSIQEVLNKICKYESTSIAVASRTDAGVHAQGQVVKVTIPLKIQSQKLLLGMNSLLPQDIRIMQCTPSNKAFNPNKECKYKEYHYYFCTNTINNPVQNDIVTHIGTLDIEPMQEACKYFIGKHDFYGFAKRDTSMTSTFRTVISCEILEIEASALSKKTYYLKIIGEGFLRYMVRYIMGALFEIGKRQLRLNDIREVLGNPKAEKLSAKAKSKGLHLIKISYE